MNSLTLLALAAMRSRSTALAAIQDGRCIASNEQWLRLTGDRAPAWRALLTGSRPEHAALEQLALEEAARVRRDRRASQTIRCERSGSGAVVELRLERVHGYGTGAHPVILAVASEITAAARDEREHARAREAAELQERMRALGELASGVAHDLNNTLHALRLRLSRVSACVSGCAEHSEDIRAIERIAADAGSRVKRLQDLALRRADVPEERVDLVEVIAVAAAVASEPPGEQEQDRSIAIEVALPALPHVIGNTAELGDVLLELLLNARDAMPSGGRIAISGAVAGLDQVEIAVSDEGRGIPAENLERIFEPFFTTKGRRGTGLGLSIAAGVMRRLGGSIRAENRPGGGALFTLRFPVASEALDMAPRLDGDVPASPTGPARRVLVVDDDPDNLDAMQLVLRQDGHDVEVTASGLDAASRVDAGERYDLVLCDLGLGDTTGWEVASRMRSTVPEMRIVLVTGWAEEIPRDDPRRMSVARIVSKPLGLGELRAIIAEAVPLARPTTEAVEAHAGLAGTCLGDTRSPARP